MNVFWENKARDEEKMWEEILKSTSAIANLFGLQFLPVTSGEQKLTPKYLH